jgi:biotin carboxyl carrier protein
MSGPTRQPANNGGRTVGTTAYRVELGGQAVTVEVSEHEDGLYVSVGDGPAQRVDVVVHRDDGELALVVGGRTIRGLVGRRTGGLTVVTNGEQVDAVVLDERAARLASAAGGRQRGSQTTIQAPMPGLVVAVPVEVGQAVAKGTTLVVLSAMKMQNELTAPADGTVKEILASAGQTVDQGQALVRLE